MNERDVSDKEFAMVVARRKAAQHARSMDREEDACRIEAKEADDSPVVQTMLRLGDATLTHTPTKR